MLVASLPVAKKAKKAAPKDYHASSFMVRFPEDYRKKLERIRKLGKLKTLTDSARQAVDELLARLEAESKGA
jgi:hypothetical protein